MDIGTPTCNWLEARRTSSARMSSGSLPMSVISRIGVFACSLSTREEATETRVNMSHFVRFSDPLPQEVRRGTCLGLTTPLTEFASNADKRL